jgi:SAM-dependent methyltransferase
MIPRDAFHEIAPFYDRIMDHVDYDRWFTVATGLAALLPSRFVHVDAACGTGTLLKRLRNAGWNSLGIDLSFAMIKAGTKGTAGVPAAVADLRALPLLGGVDYVTCLFDSVNFLVDPGDMARAFREIHDALSEQGLFYFDVVTEQMVTRHFEGQEWTEDNGRFSTTWRSTYSRADGITETFVRVNTGPSSTVRERVYDQEEIQDALRDAGFTLLGAFDAHAWKLPTRHSVRIEFVAAKRDSRLMRKRFGKVCVELRRRLS